MTAGVQENGRGTRPGPGFGPVLRSEWRKFLATPANRLVLVLAFVLTVGVTVLMVVFGDSAAIAREQAEGEYAVIFFAGGFGTLAFAGLAGGMVASEFRGPAVWTLAASPRRWRPLLAKLVIVAALALVVGLAVAQVNFHVSQAALRAAGEPTLSLGAPGMLRATLVYIPLGMAVQAVLTACAAAVLRSAAGAFTAVFLVNLLPVVTAPFLGEWWMESVPRFTYGAATESVAGIAVPGSEGYLPTAAAVLVLVAWAAVFVAVAVAVFERRDV
ncbi:hypothetical protein ABZ249_11030 [Nocardiopsis sp. NPDC006139]|uniref:hypothetical protein n=1 Tax=Nocardiopsis sp. NPDC006139 TaxID=3154578 RepID=UPI001597D6DA|nr:hypothetical protein HUT17_00140 [Nocardiopsis flavescens]